MALPCAIHPGDTVLIYWAGHGGRCANTDGTQPDGYDEYLVPFDGSLESDAAIKSLKSSMTSLGFCFLMPGGSVARWSSAASSGYRRTPSPSSMV